jgi:hypothetical protein
LVIVGIAVHEKREVGMNSDTEIERESIVGLIGRHSWSHRQA